MTGKPLLTVSLLLPFMVMSGVVHADSKITKKNHRPNEVTVRAQAMPRPTTERCAYQYQGGPKSSLWTCRRSYSFEEDSALKQATDRAQAIPRLTSGYGPTTERCAYQYQGGPKSSLWACRR